MLKKCHGGVCREGAYRECKRSPMGVCVVLHQAKQGGSWVEAWTEREAVICCIIKLNSCTLRKHMLEV